MNVTHAMRQFSDRVCSSFPLPIGLRAESGRNKENPEHGHKSARARWLMDVIMNKETHLGSPIAFAAKLRVRSVRDEWF